MGTDEEPRSSFWVMAIGVGLWLLSVGVLIFLFVSVPPPFQDPWLVLKWLAWCAVLVVAGLTFLITVELFLNPLLNGSGEPGEAIIRTGVFGIGILVIVFLVIRVFLN